MRPAFASLFAALLLTITAALGAVAVRRPVVDHTGAADILPGAELKGATSGGVYHPLHKGGVDLSTGLYTREDEDLVVFDTLPLVLRRTYLVGDRISRQFGVGGTHPGEWYLIGDGRTFQWAELILSTGGRIHFDRVSPGTSARDGVFDHRATPTTFFGAKIEWTAAGWAMKFAGGGVALFAHCNPDNSDICSILELQDDAGHRIRYVRDRAGTLVEMQGDSGAITFEYDAKRRVSAARDSSGAWVGYEYDARGRLSLVRASDGTTRSYTYDDLDRMLTIDDPGRHIENEYDSGNRVVRQTIRLQGDAEASVIKLRYTTVNGVVRATEFVDYDGEETRYTWNASHYLLSKVVGLARRDPVKVTFERDPKTNLSRTITVECRVQGEARTATMPAPPRDDDGASRELVARTCR